MKQIKCNKCQYEWKTKSNLKYISCPSCIQKVLNPNYSPTSNTTKGAIPKTSPPTRDFSSDKNKDVGEHNNNKRVLNNAI